jgi:hypothetical protein
MTRVLVVHHDLDVSDIEVDLLRRAGYEVDQCQGPVGGSPCPVLHGERCWQVEKADVLVYDAWLTGDGAETLVDDLRDLHPDKPVVVTSPGMMASWAEAGGRHGVTRADWAAQGGLAGAIEDAIERGPEAPSSPEPGKSQAEETPPKPGPHW